MSTTHASVGSVLRLGSREWSRVLLVLGSIATLAAGVGIYIFFRPDDFVGLATVGLGGRAIRAPSGGLSVFFVYSLPGLLWVLSATLGQATIWLGRRGLASSVWLATPLVVGCLWELGQSEGLLQGTADLVDLVAYLIGWGLGMGATVLCDSRRL